MYDLIIKYTIYIFTGSYKGTKRQAQNVVKILQNIFFTAEDFPFAYL